MIKRMCVLVCLLASAPTSCTGNGQGFRRLADSPSGNESVDCSVHGQASLNGESGDDRRVVTEDCAAEAVARQVDRELRCIEGMLARPKANELADAFQRVRKLAQQFPRGLSDYRFVALWARMMDDVVIPYSVHKRTEFFALERDGYRRLRGMADALELGDHQLVEAHWGAVARVADGLRGLGGEIVRVRADVLDTYGRVLFEESAQRRRPK